MTFAERNTRASLAYLLQGTSNNDYKSWGYEYISNLASDIGAGVRVKAGEQRAFQRLDRASELNRALLCVKQC